MKLKELTRKQIKDICKQYHGQCEKKEKGIKCPLWQPREWEDLLKEPDYIWCPYVLIHSYEIGLITKEQYEEHAAKYRDIEIEL